MNECRDIFLEKIIEYVHNGEDIYLVTADLGAPCIDQFRIDYPKRHVSVGIAEQNLIAVSSGLAIAGKKVIAYTANPFLTFRAFDQIRNCAGLMNLKLAMAGLGAGFSAPDYGATHFILEDLNILRGTPNLTVYNISCKNLTRYCAQKVLELDSPIYVRIDRLVNVEYALTKDDVTRGYRFLNNAKSGKICVVATGIMTSACLEVLHTRSDFLEKVSMIDLFSFPFDAGKLAGELKKYPQIITVEEMRRQGGMGSAVLEALSDADVNIHVKRMGVDISTNLDSHYGSREWHLKQFGLDKKSIAEKISEML